MAAITLTLADITILNRLNNFEQHIQLHTYQVSQLLGTYSILKAPLSIYLDNIKIDEYVFKAFWANAFYV